MSNLTVKQRQQVAALNQQVAALKEQSERLRGEIELERVMPGQIAPTEGAIKAVGRHLAALEVELWKQAIIDQADQYQAMLDQQGYTKRAPVFANGLECKIISV